MKRLKWDIDNITDQQGKTAIVTGAGSGIGFETARVLAHKNARVIVAVRNPEKGAAAVDKIISESPGGAVELMDLDLAGLASVRRFAAAFSQSHSRLDLLINNAGVMIPPYGKTRDGFELQFGTNHLGHFALTGLLLDLVRQTPGSRIVNVSSMAHRWGDIDFGDLNWDQRPYAKWRAYGDSKIANLHFTHGLQQRLGNGDAGVTVAAAHPGWTATGLQRHLGLSSSLNFLFAQKPAMGALPTLYAATAPDVAGTDFYGPGGYREIRGYPKRVEPVALAKDRTIADKLWEASETLTGVAYSLN